MVPARMKLKDSSCKMRAHCYWNTNWGNSLKNISCLLPVSEPENGRAFSKKETLIHMLRYFDFLQTHIQRLHSNLPPHYLPQPNDREGSDSESDDTAHSELCTPPCILKAKRKYSCGRSRKKDTPNSELIDDKSQTLRKEDADRNVTTITNGDGPHARAADETAGSAEDNSLPCSSDSNYSVGAVLPTTSSSTAGSSVDQESPCQGLGSQCSICDDRTGSEDGSQGSKELASPPSGSFILKDEMFGVLPPSGKTQLDDSPTLLQTPMLPFLPLLGFQEGLNLSPSLLTSPARGLSHTLLPDGQEELQTLFEDVWVTPKPAAPKHCTRGNDSPAFSQSKEEDRHSDDITWSPNQLIHMKKGWKGHHKKASRKGQAVSGLKKKKCVNGFIMFCRMNRRLYLRTHPGLPSTVVTKELANLWCIMPKQERRVYCLKARQFSRQHNRNVRVSEGQEAEEEKEDYVPSPLHVLLAHRDLWFTSNAKP